MPTGAGDREQLKVKLGEVLTWGDICWLLLLPLAPLLKLRVWHREVSEQEAESMLGGNGKSQRNCWGNHPSAVLLFCGVAHKPFGTRPTSVDVLHVLPRPTTFAVREGATILTCSSMHPVCVGLRTDTLILASEEHNRASLIPC